MRDLKAIPKSEIVKMIKRKKNDKSFVCAYWSLAHQRMLRECFASQEESKDAQNFAKINQSFNGMEDFGEVDNKKQK